MDFVDARILSVVDSGVLQGIDRKRVSVKVIILVEQLHLTGIPDLENGGDGNGIGQSTGEFSGKSLGSNLLCSDLCDFAIAVGLEIDPHAFYMGLWYDADGESDGCFVQIKVFDFADIVYGQVTLGFQYRL